MVRTLETCYVIIPHGLCLQFLFPDAKVDADDTEQGKMSTASTPCEDGPLFDRLAGGATKSAGKSDKETTPPTPTEPVAPTDHSDHKTHLIVS